MYIHFNTKSTCKLIVHVQVTTLPHPALNYHSSTYLFYHNTHLINYPCLTTHYQFFSPHSDNLAEQLYNASISSDSDTVLGLLRRGADPNSDWYERENSGYTPLMVACYYNRPLIARHLVQWGARTDTRTVDTNRTALHYACREKSIECVRVLLAHHSPTGEPGCVCSCV